LSVNYPVPILTSRLQIVATALDAGGANGVLRLLSGGGNVLSSLPLARPAATVVNGTLAFNGLSLIDPAAVGSGAAVAARCEDSTGATVISGLTVNVGVTPDILLSPSNFIAAGQTVAITAATITGN
jgi:hypothetical protein